MIHGWPDTSRLWDAQAAFLKSRYRCMRFTLPGFDAAKPRRVYQLDEIIAFIRQVITELNPSGKVILMLHDWGCVVGYEFHMRHPQLVSRIVGVDIGSAKGLWRAWSARHKFFVLAYQIWLALAWIVGGGLGDRMSRYMARRARYPGDMAAVSSCMAYSYYMSWFGGAQSYRKHLQPFKPACPMLFIYGRRKPFMFHTQRWIDELAQQPGSEVAGFDTGHWVMLQEPARFNQLVGRWLSSPAGGGTTSGA